MCIRDSPSRVQPSATITRVPPYPILLPSSSTGIPHTPSLVRYWHTLYGMRALLAAILTCGNEIEYDATDVRYWERVWFYRCMVLRQGMV
eukprot:2105956-Rhodomonas_salina.2